MLCSIPLCRWAETAALGTTVATFNSPRLWLIAAASGPGYFGLVSGKAVVSKDITEPGVYAASFMAEPAKEWSRKVARFRRLGQLIERVNKLEKADK